MTTTYTTRRPRADRQTSRPALAALAFASGALLAGGLGVVISVGHTPPQVEAGEDPAIAPGRTVPVPRGAVAVAPPRQPGEQAPRRVGGGGPEDADLPPDPDPATAHTPSVASTVTPPADQPDPDSTDSDEPAPLVEDLDPTPTPTSSPTSQPASGTTTGDDPPGPIAEVVDPLLPGLGLGRETPPGQARDTETEVP